MSAIRSRDTKPEMTVRRTLHKSGIRYRLHRTDLLGKPDIVIASALTLVFVNGCFWHHHGCKYSQWPKTRAAFWSKKIQANVCRDQLVYRSLRREGWKVEVVWECKIRNERYLSGLVSRISERRLALRRH